MNKYLLLRDNKQTGPYTVEELAKKGLKPYDLVWLEGRSAAWRYPSEMEELKSFAPAVEEQPYDRFYKRSSSAQEHAIHAAEQAGKLQQVPVVEKLTETSLSAQAETISPMAAKSMANLQQQPVAQSTQTIQPENIVDNPLPASGSGKVYVTLPAGFRKQPQTEQKTATATTLIDKKEIEPVAEQPAVEPVQQQEEAGVSKEAAQALEARAAALARNIQLAAAEAAAKKQSGPVSQVNNRPVTKPVKQEEKTTSFSTIIDKGDQQETVPVIPIRNNRKQVMLMRGIVAACLLLGGIVIGMALTYSNNRSSSQQALDQLVQRLQEREAQRQANTAGTLQANEDPGQSHGPSQIADQDPAPSPEHTAIPGKQALNHQQVASREKIVSSPVNQEPAVTFQEKDPAPMKVTPAVVTNKETSRPVREADISAAREKIYQMVQVAASPFKTGVLGGISNLYFTVSNSSSFPLDQIELEVKYLGPENRVVKVQRLLFTDIAAGGHQTLEAPRTSRGVSIDYAVTKINSKALGIAHAGF